MRSNVPKVVGADVELSNFILGVQLERGTGAIASRRLLAQIVGIDSGTATGAPALDWGRKYLPTNGGCFYIDSDHLELALPETLSAFDHLAYWRAMVHEAREARRRANADLPDGYTLQVLANCSDGLGNSYGSHLNILVTRPCWDDIVSNKPHYLAYLAAFQISSIVYTGQGKVGSERGRRHTHFQLSQRADFMRTLSHIDTMGMRGVINTRDESHCGSRLSATERALARLHVIFFDSTLCQVATVLRVGTMQMIAAMIEAGDVDARLALDAPLEALDAWTQDPSLAATATRIDGSTRTAVELQLEFLAAAQRFADRGGFIGIVPEWQRLLALWETTLLLLEARDFDAASRRLDWVAKYRLLDAVRGRHHLNWDAPTIKQLDQLYADIDDADGIFWALERDGQVERLVTDEAIVRATSEPPDDTRAWTRAHLLRLAGDERIERVAWDRVDVRTALPHFRFWRVRPVHLPLPYHATRSDNERLFVDGVSLESVVDHLRSDAAAVDVLPTVDSTRPLSIGGPP